MASTTNVNNNNGLGGAITPATTSATTPSSTSVTTNLAGQVQANRAATTSYPIINLAPSQKYYTKISVNKYGRQSFLQAVKSNTTAGYQLPMPLQIVDTNSVKWEEEALGIVGGTAMNAMGAAQNIDTDSIKSAVENFSLSSVLSSIKTAGAGAATSGAISNGGQVGSAASAMAGIAPNEFLTMLFKGPTYKRFELRFLISPNSSRDAQDIRKAVVEFKNAMAPSLSGGGYTFDYPDIFNVSFSNENTLYAFKPSVLSNFSVNYNPPGLPAFHNDGQPESYLLSMNFIEIEFWLKGDFK